MIYNVANQKNAFSKAEKEQLNQDIEELKSKDEALDNEIETLKENKVDKATSEGGFAGGNNTIASTGGALGENATAGSGAAIGKGASATNGAALGYQASTNSGAAIGFHATATGTGGAIGSEASSVNGGAVGNEAVTSIGFAGGSHASSSSGGAAGFATLTTTGFAGGNRAKTAVLKEDGTIDHAINAIQLGTGTNSIPETLQVYDYQLMDADGNIPEERLPDGILKNLSDNDKQINIDNVLKITYEDTEHNIAIGTDTTANHGISIGDSAKSGFMGIAIGSTAAAIENSTIAIGINAKTYEKRAIAIGSSAIAGDPGACAIGLTASANAINAIQLGSGTNENENTLQVYDYQLMDANGKIPNERLNIVIPRFLIGDFIGSKTEAVYIDNFPIQCEKHSMILSKVNTSSGERRIVGMFNFTLNSNNEEISLYANNSTDPCHFNLFIDQEKHQLVINFSKLGYSNANFEYLLISQ